jgi:hypothetical protein
MTDPRSSAVRLLSVRYRAVLFLALVAVPMATTALLRGPSSELGLTTMVGLPLFGDGQIPTWVALTFYTALVTSPLLTSRHPAFEVGAPGFASRSFLFPHTLAAGIGLAMLVALWALPMWASAVFWVASSMATANLGALLLGQHSWVGLMMVGVVVLSLLLQHRLDVGRSGTQAAIAVVAWMGLGLAVIGTRRHRLRRS